MGEITLEKIDIVRERSGVSYQYAKDYLDKASGNVVDALVLIEEEVKRDKASSKVNKDEIMSKLKEKLEKGNVTKIVIKKDGEKFFEVPVNVGLSVAFILGIISPVFLWAGIIVGSVTSVKIEIVKEDGSVEEVNRIFKSVGADLKEKTGEHMSTLKEKAGEVSETIKTKADEVSGTIKTRAGEMGDNIKTKAGEMGDNIKTKAEEVGENIKTKSYEIKDKAVDGMNKIKDTVQDKGSGASDEIKKKISDVKDVSEKAVNKAKDATGNMFYKIKDKINVNNLKKEDNSFTYKVDFDDDQIKYSKENDDLSE